MNGSNRGAPAGTNAAAESRPRHGRLQRLAWPAFIAACLLNLYGVYWPSEPGPPLPIPDIDKVAHICLFGLVAFTGRWAGVRWWILGPALVVQAVGSELVQATIEGATRDGDPWDVAADLVGSALGWLVHLWWQVRRRQSAGARAPR